MTIIIKEFIKNDKNIINELKELEHNIIFKKVLEDREI